MIINKKKERTHKHKIKINFFISNTGNYCIIKRQVLSFCAQTNQHKAKQILQENKSIQCTNYKYLLSINPEELSLDELCRRKLAYNEVANDCFGSSVFVFCEFEFSIVFGIFSFTSSFLAQISS